MIWRIWRRWYKQQSNDVCQIFFKCCRFKQVLTIWWECWLQFFTIIIKIRILDSWRWICWSEGGTRKGDEHSDRYGSSAFPSVIKYKYRNTNPNTNTNKEYKYNTNTLHTVGQEEVTSKTNMAAQFFPMSFSSGFATHHCHNHHHNIAKWISVVCELDAYNLAASWDDEKCA